MRADRQLQKCGAPPPPVGDWTDLNPLRHATGEPVTGATTDVN